jgi:integrase/recombinase XerD
MRGRQAKTLSEADIRRLLRVAQRSKSPARNSVIVLLSVRAGLRAGEIAKLEWNMVVDATGRVGNLITLPGSIVKYGLGRRIPVHGELKRALVALWRISDEAAGPVVMSQRGGAMSAGSIVNWFTSAVREAGLEGCSSHSGRRTFVTRAARLVHKVGGSLRDVQQLVGHRSIETTQGYIDGDSDAQRRLVRLL